MAQPKIPARPTYSWAPKTCKKRFWGIRRGVTAVIFGIICTGATGANANPSDLCLTSARTVAFETNIPLSVLLAITLTETGRVQGDETRPWPWAINREGVGNWFENRQQAFEFARASIAEGRTSFDVGCFQINYRWHGENFSSLEEMFDPVVNARYAASFLTQMYNETGDWSEAAGAYHSRTQELAARYRTTFDSYRRKAIEQESDSNVAMAFVAPEKAGSAPLPNSYSLLQTGLGTGQLGSLVPIPDAD